MHTPLIFSHPFQAATSNQVVSPGRGSIYPLALPHKALAGPNFSGVGGMLAQGITKMEGASNYEMTKMVEHTLGSTGSRLLVSKSPVEQLEIAVTETIEGLLVFFGISSLINKYLGPLTNKVAKLQATQDKTLAQQAIKAMPLEHLPKQLPARVGAIVAAMGATLFAGEFGMLFAKNLGTIALFDKASFSQVLDLSDHAHENAKEETLKRSKKGLVISLGLAATSMLSGLGIARYGKNMLAGLSKQSLTKLQKMVGKFDLAINDKAGQKAKHFLLGQNQMRAYMAISGLGYMLAARDHLERMEILPRFTLIFLYLGWFKELFEQKLLYPLVKKRAPELFDIQTEDGKTSLALKSNKEIAPVLAKAKPSQARKLQASKNALFLAPYVVGMGLVSLLNAALNRYFTYQRFERQQREKAETTIGHLKPLAPQVQGFAAYIS